MHISLFQKFTKVPNIHHRNFVVTMITPVAIKTIGYKYYIVYTCIGAFVPITVYFLYPEVSSPDLGSSFSFY